MEADEAWSWFWSPEEERFYLRRADESLAGLPDDARSAGVAEARENGRYLDFAIPTTAVEAAAIEKGQSWRFEVEADDDNDTIMIDRE